MIGQYINTHGLRFRALKGTCIRWNNLALEDARLVFEYEQRTGAMRVTSGRFATDLKEYTTDEAMLRLVENPEKQITPQQLVDWAFCEWARGSLELFHAEGATIETPGVDGAIKKPEQAAEMVSDKMYSIVEALDYLKEERGISLSRRHLQKLILDGKIPEAQKIGKHGNSYGLWGIPKSWLDGYYKAKPGRPRADEMGTDDGPDDVELQAEETDSEIKAGAESLA